MMESGASRGLASSTMSFVRRSNILLTHERVPLAYGIFPLWIKAELSHTTQNCFCPLSLCRLVQANANLTNFISFSELWSSGTT
jgi:hypothetical protein